MSTTDEHVYTLTDAGRAVAQAATDARAARDQAARDRADRDAFAEAFARLQSATRSAGCCPGAADFAHRADCPIGIALRDAVGTVPAVEALP